MARKADEPRNGHNQGSVYLRGDGRWVAVVSVGYTSEGRQARKSFYAKTEGEAKRKLRQALARLDKGGGFGDDKLTIGTFLDRWLEDSVKPSLSASTYKTYRSIIINHLSPGLGKVRVTKLTPAQIRTFLNQKTEDGCSAALVRYMRVVLAAALQQALHDEIVIRNVASLTDAPRATQFEASPLTADEANRFLAAARSDRLEALYSVALSLGLRQGETIGLRWQDIDLEAGMLHVRNQISRIDDGYRFVELKTKASRRILPIPREVLDSLKRHKRRQLEDQLFAGDRWVSLNLVFASTIGTPLEPSNLRLHYKGLLERAGISDRRYHDLRHSCGSLLIARGVQQGVVKEILGHSRIATTMDNYVHVDIDSMRDATDRMSDLFSADKVSS